MKANKTVKHVAAVVLISSLTASLIVNKQAVDGYAQYEPNPAYTIGVVNPALTDEVLRAKDFTTKNYRSVSEAVKRQVYKNYGMSIDTTPCPCEVDHFISLELGGSNDIKNLWPESYSGKWNAHDKDKLEDTLGRLVRKGVLSGELARKEITDGWVNSYIKRFGDKYKQ